MKISEIPRLGLLTQTLQDAQVNPLVLITQDEFNKESGSTDYRETAIQRVLKAGVNFTSEINTLENLLKSVLVPRCPKCWKILKLKGGGGSMSSYTVYGCCKKCGLKISFTLPVNCVEVSYE